MAKYRCIIANKKITARSRRIDIIDGFKVPVPGLTIEFKNHLLDTSKLEKGEEIEKFMDRLLRGPDARRWNSIILKIDFTKEAIKRGLDKQIDKLQKRKEEIDARKVTKGAIIEHPPKKEEESEPTPAEPIKINLNAPVTEGEKIDGETEFNRDGGSQPNTEEA